HQSNRPGSTARDCRRSGSGAIRVTGTKPSTGRIPASSATTSEAKRRTVPRPQAGLSPSSARLRSVRGSCAASLAPAASPTDDSSAEDTTAGSPQASMTDRPAAMPPKGWTLTMMTSAAPSAATRSGSSALRIDSSARPRTRCVWQRVLGLADRFVGGEHDRQIPVGQFLTQAGHVLDAGDRLFEVLEVEVGEFGAGALRLGEAVAGVRVQAQRGVGQDPTELPQAGEVIGE